MTSEYLITSNINLLKSNSVWQSNFLKKKIDIDDYNKIILSLNEKKILSKYNNFIGIIYLNDYFESNTRGVDKILKKIVSSNKSKKFYFLLYLQLNNNYQIDKDYKIKANTLYNSLLKLNKNNLFTNMEIFSKNSYFNTRNKYFLRCPFSFDGLQDLSRNVEGIISTHTAKPFKLIILDCDNTLWGGTIGEDGVVALQYSEDGNGKLFENIQKHLKYLKKIGFLLSISSKNNEQDVWNSFKNRNMKLSKKDFLFPKINWDEKSININKILKESTLKEDDVLFVDDSKLEIDKVKKKFPKISTLCSEDVSEYFDKLLNHPRLQKINVLKEDKKKYYQYKLKNRYEDLKIQSTGFDDIYIKLKQKIKILDINNSNINRAEQLYNKTNQFNFSTKRYNRNQLLKIKNNKNTSIKLISLSDKFGHHGIVGSYVYQKISDKIVILDFLLSCRVLSRKIEEYIIYKIKKINKNKEIFLRYIQTEKNKELIKIFLKRNYFYKIKSDISKKLKIKGELFKILDKKEINNVKKYF